MGIIIAFFSACFQTAKDLVSKRLAFSVGGTVSAFASFVYALPFYILLLTILWAAGYEDFRFTALFFRYVLLRSLSDTAAEWLKMSALRCGDISLVASFFSLSPLFLLFTSPLITGDKISTAGMVAVVIVVMGSIIAVFEPRDETDSANRWKGIGLALLSALFFSINTCFDRLAVFQASPALSGMAMTALSGLFLAPFVLPSFSRRQEFVEHRRPFLIRGGLEVIFMVTKLWALQYLPAPLVACIQRLSIPLSVLGGKIFYKEPHFGRRILGALVILLGAVLVIFEDRFAAVLAFLSIKL